MDTALWIVTVLLAVGYLEWRYAAGDLVFFTMAGFVAWDRFVVAPLGG